MLQLSVWLLCFCRRRTTSGTLSNCDCCCCCCWVVGGNFFAFKTVPPPVRYWLSTTTTTSTWPARHMYTYLSVSRCDRVAARCWAVAIARSSKSEPHQENYRTIGTQILVRAWRLQLKKKRRWGSTAARTARNSLGDFDDSRGDDSLSNCLSRCGSRIRIVTTLRLSNWITERWSLSSWSPPPLSAHPS